MPPYGDVGRSARNISFDARVGIDTFGTLLQTSAGPDRVVITLFSIALRPSTPNVYTAGASKRPSLSATVLLTKAELPSDP